MRKKIAKAVNMLGTIFAGIGIVTLGAYFVRAGANRYQIYLISKSFEKVASQHEVANADLYVNIGINSSKTEYFPDLTKKDPMRIIVPSVGIDQKVIESKIIDGEWELSDRVANHLTTSSDPGGNGNIIIYGHNHHSILGNLRYIKEGAQVTIIDIDSLLHTYTVVDTYEVDPDQVELIQPTKEEVLTLYTCSDFLGSKRFIVVAKK